MSMSAHAVLVDQPAQERDDPRLGRHVERGGRLVGDEEPRAERDRHGDPDPLPLAARELVRIAASAESCAAGRPTRSSVARAMARASAPAGGAVHPHRLGHLVADRLQRVQRRHRLLEDHADVAAADPAHLRLGAAHEVAAVEADPPRRHRPCRQQPHHRERGHRLARPALADHPEHLPRRELPSTRRAGPGGRGWRPTGLRRRGGSSLARPEEEPGRVRRRHAWRRGSGSSPRPPRPPPRRGRRARRPRRCRGRSPAGPCAGPAPASAPLKSTPLRARPAAPARRCGRRSRAWRRSPGSTRARGRCRPPPPPPGRRPTAPSAATMAAARAASRRSASDGAAPAEHARRGRGGRSGSRAGRAPRKPSASKMPATMRSVESSPGRQPADHPRRQPQHGEVEPERAELRPHDPAGEGHLPAARRAQVGEEPARLLEMRRRPPGAPRSSRAPRRRRGRPGRARRAGRSPRR